MPRKRKETSENYNKAFPTAMRHLMEETTQADLAKALGKTRQSITYYCDGSSSPDWETLVKIANYFHVSTDYLLGLTNNPTTDKDLDAVCSFTGLSEQSIDRISFLRDLDCNNLLKLFNSFTSDPSIPGFFLKFLQYCRASEEYRSAKNTREKEVKDLEDKTNGDVVSEIRLRSSGQVTITYNQVDIDNLLDTCDLAEFKLSKSFMAIAKKIAEEYQTESSNEKSSDF